MPERTSYKPGTPSWIDLGTPDPEAAKRFYGSLFGWQAEDAGPPEETGGYAFFLRNGRRVAGFSPLMGEDQPTAWSTYVATDDADSVAQRAEAAGAAVVVAPMDVMDAGRMAFFSHPAAGFIGVWQAGTHTGSQLAAEPGTFNWSELHTRDLEGAKAFGESVFGWRIEDRDFDGATYTVVHVGEDGVGGMMAMQEGVPEQVPAHWLAYFAVEDCDAAVATAQEAGGSVAWPAMSMAGVGRFAGLADPQGAQFAVITPDPGS